MNEWARAAQETTDDRRVIAASGPAASLPEERPRWRTRTIAGGESTDVRAIIKGAGSIAASETAGWCRIAG